MGHNLWPWGHIPGRARKAPPPPSPLPPPPTAVWIRRGGLGGCQCHSSWQPPAPVMTRRTHDPNLGNKLGCSLAPPSRGPGYPTAGQCRAGNDLASGRAGPRLSVEDQRTMTGVIELEAGRAAGGSVAVAWSLACSEPAGGVPNRPSAAGETQAPASRANVPVPRPATGRRGPGGACPGISPSSRAPSCGTTRSCTGPVRPMAVRLRSSQLRQQPHAWNRT